MACYVRMTQLRSVGNFRPQKLGSPLTKSWICTWNKSHGEDLCTYLERVVVLRALGSCSVGALPGGRTGPREPLGLRRGRRWSPGQTGGPASGEGHRTPARKATRSQCSRRLTDHAQPLRDFTGESRRLRLRFHETTPENPRDVTWESKRLHLRINDL